MLTKDTRLQVVEQDVAAKVMDGEAIIINVSNGFYYTLGGGGGEMWDLIRAGRPLGTIASEMSERYEVERSRIAEDLERLAEELLDEGLVEPVSDGEGDESGTEPGLTVGNGVAGTAYEPPVLHTYRDMAELLALDPPMPGLAEPGAEDTAESAGEA